LGELSIKLSEQLPVILNTVQTISSLHTQAANIYSELGEHEISKLHKAMDEFFKDIVESTKNLNKKIKVHFEQPAKYRKGEFAALSNLLQEWESSRKQIVIQRKKLNKKKEGLFETKMIEQWQLAPGCKYTPQELLNSKDVAFKEMLPEETKEVIKHKETYGYYSNKVKEEFRRLCDGGVRMSLQRLKDLVHSIKSAIDQVLFTYKVDS